MTLFNELKLKVPMPTSANPTERVLRLGHHEEFDARLWPAATAWALNFAEIRQQAILLCARLTGGVLALGRFQRESDVLSEEAKTSAAIRRLSSGRSCALGDGVIAVALAVPHRDWFADEPHLSLSTSKILNRGVRGILSGLGSLGISASYFGRDFLSADSGQAGLLGFDSLPSGAALLECILASDTHWWPPNGSLKAPLPPFSKGFPPPSDLPQLAELPSRNIATAVGRGYRDRFGWNLRAIPVPWPALEPWTPDAPLKLPFESKERELPMGHFRISIEIQEGSLQALSLSGEFLADSPGIQVLNDAIKGQEPKLSNLIDAFNALLSNPAHTLLGIPNFDLVQEALEEALGWARRCKRSWPDKTK